jgi:hypothetical protein
MLAQQVRDLPAAALSRPEQPQQPCRHLYRKLVSAVIISGWESNWL